MDGPSSPSPSPMSQIGQDQIFCILQLLPVESILSFSMTCRKFRSLASSDSLWELICRRDWGPNSVDGLRESRTASWKSLYQQLSQLGSVSCSRLLAVDGIFPRPRASHSLNFVSDCLVLFGGGCEGGQLIFLCSMGLFCVVVFSLHILKPTIFAWIVICFFIRPIHCSSFVI